MVKTIVINVIHSGLRQCNISENYKNYNVIPYFFKMNGRSQSMCLGSEVIEI